MKKEANQDRQNLAIDLLSISFMRSKSRQSAEKKAKPVSLLEMTREEFKETLKRPKKKCQELVH